MKKIKLFTSIATLSSISAIPFATLTSCNDSNAVINFTASEGVTLEGSSSLAIPKGTKWSEIVSTGKVPEPVVTAGYTTLGWCVQTTADDWEELTEEYVFESNVQVRYVAYDETSHPAMTVTLDYKPGGSESEKIDLDFAQNFTLAQFRHYYGIPMTPETEGYTFKQFERNGVKINDTEVLSGEADSIKINWTINTYVCNFKTNGHGTINLSTKVFEYGTTWADIKTNVITTPENEYVFDKWVDEDGDDIWDTFEMKKDFTATAIFKKTVKRQVNFTCSEGVTLSSYEPSWIAHGSTWRQLITAGGVPAVSVPDGWKKVGWVNLNKAGKFEIMEDTTVIDSNMTVMYFAYDPEVYSIKVNFVYGPSQEAIELAYTKGVNVTFGDFREFYEIPETITYEGYTFDGYYKGDTKLNDESTPFPEDESEVTIEAHYKQNQCTVSLRTDGHGTVSTSSKIIPYGSKWSKVVEDVTLTPAEGYQFTKWWDETHGKEITNDTVITDNISAVAYFDNQTVTFKFGTEGYHLQCLRMSNNSHGSHVDIKSSETKSYFSEQNSGFLYPTLKDNTLVIKNSSRSTDLRFVVVSVFAYIPVKPHETRRTTIHINGKWNMHSNGYIGKSGHTSVLQAFKVDYFTHPNAYANLSSKDDKRALDPCSSYVRCFSYRELSWGDWSRSEVVDDDIATYVDDNNTDQLKTVKHEMLISFLVDGIKKTNSNKEADVELHLSGR